jgi:hypothetical protein
VSPSPVFSWQADLLGRREAESHYDSRLPPEDCAFLPPFVDLEALSEKSASKAPVYPGCSVVLVIHVHSVVIGYLENVW